MQRSEIFFPQIKPLKQLKLLLCLNSRNLKALISTTPMKEISIVYWNEALKFSSELNSWKCFVFFTLDNFDVIQFLN